MAFMIDDVSPAGAQAALASATASTDRVRAQARWMSTYTAAFGLGFGALTLVLGLVEPLWLRMAVMGAFWPIMVAVMIRWAVSRRASLPDTTRRVAKYWVATAVLYGAALAIGSARLTGELWYWIPAAALVATPMLVGAARERRA